MNHLVPCPECQRHVRSSETACPFCAAALDLAGTAPPALPSQRLGRAALFAFGATLAASLTASGCGGETEEGGKGAAGGASGAAGGSGTGGSGGGDGGGSGGSGGTTGSGGTDGTTGSGGTAGSGGTGGSGGEGGGVGPVYGLPADAGSAGFGGGQPIYGAAPPDKP